LSIFDDGRYALKRVVFHC